METTKISQAKAVLDLTINEYFSNEPQQDVLQYLNDNFSKVCNLLEVADGLLAEGIAKSE